MNEWTNEQMNERTNESCMGGRADSTGIFNIVFKYAIRESALLAKHNDELHNMN